MLFTLQNALELIETNTGNSDTSYLSKWLEETKATDGTYRPYFVIGLLLWMKPENNLIKGEGAEFDQNIETSRRFLLMQRAIDLRLNLDVPVQYESNFFLDQISPSTARSSQVGFIAF